MFRDDLTEVPGLDDLSAPSGPIAASQVRTAEAFGARDAYYLVQGTTGGLVALLLAAARRPGAARFIVPRYCHRALVSASILAGLEPVFCRSRFDGGLPAGPDLDHLRSLLAAIPDGLAAVVDTYPSIHGVAHDLGAVAEMTHAAGVPLLVDGAHASLFGLAGGMPPAPLAAGADAVVLSAHKGLGSLGQSSILLANHSPFAPTNTDLMACLRLVSTTSPSYPMLLSLETAISHRLGPAGRAELQQAVSLAAQVRERLRAAGITVMQPLGPGTTADPLRLDIDAWPLGFSGMELAGWLREQANVQVEAADWRSVLVILGPGDSDRTAGRLVSALARVRSEGPCRRGSAGQGAPAAGESVAGHATLWAEQVDLLSCGQPRVLCPRRAWFGRRSRVSLAVAAGRIAAEALAPYPPGVPAVWPGETMTPSAVATLLAVLSGGGSVHGVDLPDPARPGECIVEVCEEEGL